MIALLDVNVLVALFYDQHAQHEVAHDWFEEQKLAGWATCAATENGAIRLLSNSRAVDPALTPPEAIARLRSFRGSGRHFFWEASVSLTDETLFDHSVLRGHRQVNDVYLLGLARAAGGALATFDQSIPVRAVRGATADNLVVLSAAPPESTAGDS